LVLNAACRAALEGVAGSVASWLEVEEAASEMQQMLDNVMNDDVMEARMVKIVNDICGIKISRKSFSKGWAEAGAEGRMSRQQQTEAACNQYLLTIGDHIEAGRGASWAVVLANKPLLWELVAEATRSNRVGQQLACQYSRLQTSQPTGRGQMVSDTLSSDLHTCLEVQCI
jgi:hypothetical protein